MWVDLFFRLLLCPPLSPAPRDSNPSDHPERRAFSFSFAQAVLRSTSCACIPSSDSWDHPESDLVIPRPRFSPPGFPPHSTLHHTRLCPHWPPQSPCLQVSSLLSQSFPRTRLRPPSSPSGVPAVCASQPSENAATESQSIATPCRSRTRPRMLQEDTHNVCYPTRCYQRPFDTDFSVFVSPFLAKVLPELPNHRGFARTPPTRSKAGLRFLASPASRLPSHPEFLQTTGESPSHAGARLHHHSPPPPTQHLSPSHPTPYPIKARSYQLAHPAFEHSAPRRLEAKASRPHPRPRRLDTAYRLVACVLRTALTVARDRPN